MHAVKSKGFLLVASLLIISLLLIVGYGMMSVQSGRYRASSKTVSSAQALQLALAGFEDVRAKLELDQDFPPHPAEDQKIFNYAEDVIDAGNPIGSYEVEVNTEHNRAPWFLVKVTCTGVVGPKEKPLASRRVIAELRHMTSDVTADVRWVWVKFEDLGSL